MATHVVLNQCKKNREWPLTRKTIPAVPKVKHSLVKPANVTILLKRMVAAGTAEILVAIAWCQYLSQFQMSLNLESTNFS